MDINEKNTYVDFHRRGNKIMVSIRNEKTEEMSRGGVWLQYVVPLEKLLEDVAEDYDERSTTTSS